MKVILKQSIVVLFCMCMFNANAQQDTTSAKKDTVSSYKNVLNELAAIKKMLVAKQDAQKIDSITISPEILIYDENGRATGRKVPIDYATIVIQDGYILNVVIEAGGFKFNNKSAPVALTAHRFMKSDFLGNIGEGPEYQIILQHALNFAGNRSYAAKDTTLNLTKKQPKAYLMQGVMLNDILDLRLYTDAIGLLGNKNNGILMFDARTKYFIHQSNCNNSPLFLGHYVTANINFTKFDSKTDNIDTTNFSRAAFLQQSWFNADLAFNILEWLISGKSSNKFYFDVGGSLNVANSPTVNSHYITIVSPGFFGETGLHIKAADNYGFNVSLKGQFNYHKRNTIYTPYDCKKMHLFLKPSFEAYYNPFNNKASRIFARLNYWADTNKSFANETTDSKKYVEKINQFFQFQVGYAIDISKAKL